MLGDVADEAIAAIAGGMIKIVSVWTRDMEETVRRVRRANYIAMVPEKTVH